ncbi:MAG TPA: glucose-6-phosphate isomerase, partial [Burkholderiaceae bacterium]|nr:glucose-6-phosphate isomerase [Burkholderiaceae bacterium]
MDLQPSDLTASAEFQALQRHASQASHWHMAQLFAQDPERFARFSLEAAGLFLDYSKNRIEPQTLTLLLALARARGVEARRDAMFGGQRVNTTEHRAALHTALRAPRAARIQLDRRDISAEVHAVLERLYTFAKRVRDGAWLGYSGRPITDIVHIGIGGSFLGPKMVCQALRPLAHPRLRLHFVSNVDAHDLAATLAQVSPATTLFVIASKTFTTLETMMNARSARAWFLQSATAADLPRHFVAASSNLPAVQSFGIDPDNTFPLQDWVGGRYSIWSAIGLPVVLAIGPEYFAHFLAGAHAMDRHFQNAPLAANMPVLLALVGIWNRNFIGCSSLSIAPYHQNLQYFPAYLQQLEMESNGKRVTQDGQPLGVASCPALWGDVGTNGQHAYFQLLHQGSDITPVDFIAALRPAPGFQEHQATLLANCFAQSEALMRGKSAEQVQAEMQAQGMAPAEIAELAPHRAFPGNRPSNTLLMEALTPATLGALIALYEHKVLVQGTVWGINSFDQWGVELGKLLAGSIETELRAGASSQQHDSSTSGLIARTRA